jgi:small-conductance mechanosensitive channel
VVEPPGHDAVVEPREETGLGRLAGDITVEPTDTPAMLVLHNRSIVTLRARYRGVTPEERVKGVNKRFRKAVGNKDFPDATMKPYKPAILFWVGDTVVLAITASDLDPLAGDSLAQVGLETLKRLNLVLAEIREARDPKAFLRALGLALLATLLFAALLRLTRALEQFLERRVSRRETKEIGKAGVVEISITEPQQFTTITHRIFSFFAWMARLFLGYLWIHLVLMLFPYTRPWGETLGDYLLSTLQGLALGILHTMPNLFTIAVVFVIARLLTRLSRTVLDAVSSERIRIPWMYPEMVQPTRRIFVVIIWIFALIAVYPYLPGSGSEAFKGLSILLGLMLSLGGTGVVSQAMSGLVLMYSRTLHADDYVRIGDTEGVVLSLGMLATKIRTAKREEITIPNSLVLSTSTKNYSRLAGEMGVIIHTSVSIGYDEPWRMVHEQLLLAADRTAGLKKDPKPFIIQTALSDFSVEYQLNAFLQHPEERIVTLGALHAGIQDAFNEAGIAILSPHYVHLTPDENTGDTKK